MPDVFQSALAFIVVLGVLVFVHELGHYLGLDEDELTERGLE